MNDHHTYGDKMQNTIKKLRRIRIISAVLLLAAVGMFVCLTILDSQTRTISKYGTATVTKQIDSLSGWDGVGKVSTFIWYVKDDAASGTDTLFIATDTTSFISRIPILRTDSWIPIQIHARAFWYWASANTIPFRWYSTY